MMTYPQLQLYIDGHWKTADGEPVLNPADESVIGTVPHATRADLDVALAAAGEGFRLWRHTSPAKRAEIILRAAQLIRERVEDMAVVMTLEQGKPIAQSRLEVMRACDIIEWDATEGRRLYGRVIPSEAGMRHIVLRQPIGVVAAFSPWNFPLVSPARKVAGALSAGCSIILKASRKRRRAPCRWSAPSLTPECRRGAQSRVRHPLGHFRIPDPEPDGAARHLHRSDSGRQEARSACRQPYKPAIMGFGGHAPVIVCNDVDPAATAATSVAGKARNAGQVCVSPTRFFVEQDIFEPFASAFADKARAVKVGDELIHPIRWDRSRIIAASKPWRRWSRTRKQKGHASSPGAAGSAIGVILSADGAGRRA